MIWVVYSACRIIKMLNNYIIKIYNIFVIHNISSIQSLSNNKMLNNKNFKNLNQL